MTGRTRRRRKKTGLPPGTLVFAGERRVEDVKISIFDYDKDHVTHHEPKTIGEALAFRDTPTVTWMNIDGLHRMDVIEAIGTHFGVHPLVLEDIAHTDQRPKVEDFGDYLFVVIRMLTYSDERLDIDSEQISFILGPKFVISFQEREGDAFDPIRERILQNKGRVRKAGADYLVYALADAVVDRYFAILERLGDRLEELEESLIRDPSPEVLAKLRRLKREMIELRKSVWPLREVLAALMRSESKLVTKATFPYLRDLYDHTIQVIDTVETFRDMTSGAMDVYMSSVSNRMNEIMKVLTVIATIFIPITFIASVYGMNFQAMPELQHPMAYPLVLLSMVSVALVMTAYFRRRGWL